MEAAARDSRHQLFDRIVDLCAVVLISLSTVLTAWCGYQAARWGTFATRTYQVASADRLNSSILQDRANTLEIVDINLFLQYEIAIAENHPAVSSFIGRRFRPAFRPALEAWLATHPTTNPNAPTSPFVMPQYRLKQNDDAASMVASAKANFEQAQQANETGDTFVRLTVIFAAVSFLAGISTRFPFPSHAVVIALGFIMLAVGIVQLIAQPIK